MVKRSSTAVRLFIDHLAKTGGQSTGEWLRNVMYSGGVTDNVVGDHQDLLAEYGANHSVITGHVWFHGEGLHPGWHYVTVLREPIDRTLSWLSYLTSDVKRNDPDNLLVKSAEKFISSDGQECTWELGESIRNYYIHHFAAINLPRTEFAGHDLLKVAINGVSRYEHVGFFDDLTSFTGNLAMLIGKPANKVSRKIVNKTASKLSIDQFRPKLIDTIRSMTELDRKFYDLLKADFGKVRRESLDTGESIFGLGADLERDDLSVSHIDGEVSSLGDGASDFSVRCMIRLHKKVSGFDARIVLRNSRGETIVNMTLSECCNFNRDVSAGSYGLRFNFAGAFRAGNYRATIFFFSIDDQEITGLGYYASALARIEVPKNSSAKNLSAGIFSAVSIDRM